jgi:lysophospholipase L1-like esterase
MKMLLKQLVLFSFGIACLVTVSAEIEKLDSSMRIVEYTDGNIKWVDAASLKLEGKGWLETATPYSRLPLKFKSKVRPAVWTLSTHSAGIAVHFTASGTRFINARWKLGNDVYMSHMTPVGANGLDLYVKLNDKWQWLGIGKPSKSSQNKTVIKSKIPANKKFEYLLYLPLYNSVNKLELGFSPSAKIAPVKECGKPLVVYGTSIVQGCSASRPGMAWPAILGRRLDLPVINLGFSGNGKMDVEFGDIIGEIPASAYLIDCLPNMGKPQDIYERTVFLVKKLRMKQPDTPIILIEDRTHTHPDLTGNKSKWYQPRRDAFKKAYTQLIKDKINKLSYIKGEDLIGNDNESTIDGSHPTDLGMMRYCEKIEPVVREAIYKYNNSKSTK